MASRTTQTEPTFRVVPSADKCGNISILFGEHMLPTVPQDRLVCPLEAPGENLELVSHYYWDHADHEIHSRSPHRKPHPQTLMEPWSRGLL